MEETETECFRVRSDGKGSPQGCDWVEGERGKGDAAVSLLELLCRRRSVLDRGPMKSVSALQIVEVSSNWVGYTSGSGSVFEQGRVRKALKEKVRGRRTETHGNARESLSSQVVMSGTCKEDQAFIHEIETVNARRRQQEWKRKQNRISPEGGR